MKVNNCGDNVDVDDDDNEDDEDDVDDDNEDDDGVCYSWCRDDNDDAGDNEEDEDDEAFKAGRRRHLQRCHKDSAAWSSAERESSS